GGSVSAPDSAGATAGRSMPEGMNMPSDFSAWGGRAGSSAPRTSWLEVGIYVLVLLLAIAGVWFFRRNNE
ncbi:MAG: hypothetical protein J5775_04270, partial [Spirochaetales bacterium]|nr:hypothetical protein [Spirochaetales bacterium]